MSGSFSEKFNPGGRRVIWIVIALAVFGVFAYLFVTANDVAVRNLDPVVEVQPITPTQTRDVSMEGMQAQIDGMEQMLRDLRRELTVESEKAADWRETAIEVLMDDVQGTIVGRTREQEAKIAELTRLIDTEGRSAPRRPQDDERREPVKRREPIVQPPPQRADGELERMFVGAQQPAAPVASATEGNGGSRTSVAPPARLQRVVAPSVIDREQGASNDEVFPFLPATTVIPGVLVLGTEAPGGNGGQDYPTPVVMRIKDFSSLPNSFSEDQRECRILGEARGDLSSERAYIRGVRMSCVLADGRVVESEIQGHFAGEDGKAGIRGRVVNRAGGILARAVLAGLAEGASEALEQTQPVGFQIGDNGQIGLEDGTTSAGSVGARGGSNAFRRIADFYTEQAEQLFPVIEVNPGRRVDFVVTLGVELAPKKQS